MPEISVVVVTYRSASTLEACLGSLLGGATARPLDLAVVDNASDDDSVVVARRYAVEVFPQPTNGGFAAGCNVGWRATRGPWVLFANPDTAWPPGSIDALLAVAEREPALGALSPALVDEAGDLQPIVERRLTLSRAVRGLLRIGGAIRPAPPPSGGHPVEVDWVHGAALLVPRAVLEEVGGWDERYFLYAEDLDLCERLRRSGRRVLVVPEVRVRHDGGTSIEPALGRDGAAAQRVVGVTRFLDIHRGPWARRAYAILAAAVYGAGGHRAQARAAWRAVQHP